MPPNRYRWSEKIITEGLVDTMLDDHSDEWDPAVREAAKQYALQEIKEEKENFTEDSWPTMGTLALYVCGYWLEGYKQGLKDARTP
jgi:hypothetical protein